jgi:hypothetical protein
MEAMRLRHCMLQRSRRRLPHRGSLRHAGEDQGTDRTVLLWIEALKRAGAR